MLRCLQRVCGTEVSGLSVFFHLFQMIPSSPALNGLTWQPSSFWISPAGRFPVPLASYPAASLFLSSYPILLLQIMVEE